MYLRKTKWIITVSSSHFFYCFFFSSTGGVLFTNMYDICMITILCNLIQYANEGTSSQESCSRQVWPPGSVLDKRVVRVVVKSLA